MLGYSDFGAFRCATFGTLKSWHCDVGSDIFRRVKAMAMASFSVGSGALNRSV